MPPPPRSSGGFGAAAGRAPAKAPAAAPASAEHAMRFAEMARSEAAKMEAAVNAAPPPPARDVIADKQASTANGGLETSTFTVAARVRPLSSEEGMREGFACVLPAGPGKAKATQEAMVLTPKVSLKAGAYTRPLLSST
jgi:hypothetical protein